MASEPPAETQEAPAVPAAASDVAPGAGDVPVPEDPWDDQDPWQGQEGAASNPMASSPPQADGAASSAWSVIGGPPGTWNLPTGPPVTYGPAWPPWNAAAQHQPYVPPNAMPHLPGPPTGLQPGLPAAPGLAPGHVPPHLPLPPQGLPVSWWPGASNGWGWTGPPPHALPMPAPFGQQGAAANAATPPMSPARSPQRAQAQDGAGQPGQTPNGAKGGAGREDGSDNGSSSAATSDLRSLLRRRAREQERPKSSIGSVRIEEFSGDRRRYLKWKRAIEAQEKLYRLDPGELSMLVYLSAKGEARDVLDQVPLSELMGPEGGIMLWRLLDESFGESGAELFERAEKELNTYRRLPGQPITTYLAAMRRLRAQYTRIDPETVISDRAWAQRLLSRASLSKRERLDVYYSAGGSYTAAGIEAALRHRCAQVHEDERRVPSTPSSSRSPWSSSAPSSRTSASSGASTASPRKSFLGKGSGKKRQGAYVTDGADGAHDEEDLDLEVPEGDNDEPEDEDQPGEDSQEGDEIPEEEASDEEATPEEVREAFAAGWKAKAKTAGTRKARGWSQPSGGRGPGNGSSRTPSSGAAKSLAEKKRNTTCSSCGQKGHWRGDAQCPNVMAGRDPLHRKPEGQMPKEVNFTNFTFMVGGPSGSDGPPASEAPAAFVSTPVCPSCFVPALDQKFCRECGTKLLAKRDWEFVAPSQEEPQRQTRPMRDVRLPKSALTQTSKPNTHTVKMRPLEALVALDSLSKEDKKHLKYLLEREEAEDDEALPTTQEQRPIPRGGGYAPMASPSTTRTPWPSTTAASWEPLVPDPLRAPAKKDERGRDKAEGVRKRELEEFRVALWRRSWTGSRTSPSTASPMPNEKQARCAHPFEQLVWVSNQHGHFARCKRCDLKNVLYFSERHGALVAEPAAHEALAAALPDRPVGQVILDSGCRTAVAGWKWHRALQEALTEKGVKWLEVPEHEVFQFGAGGPEISEKAFLYPAGIYGNADVIRMSAVGGPADNCPGLVGPSELSRWGVCFDFAAKSLEVFGVKHAMVLSHTRHPALSILDFPAGDPWTQPGVEEKRKLLVESPQSLAFVACGADQEASSDDEGQSQASAEPAEDPHYGAEVAENERKRKVEKWLQLLESDLGIKVIEELPHDQETASEGTAGSSDTELQWAEGSEPETISSHEFGVDVASESEGGSTGASEKEDEELIPDRMGKPCFFHKAMRQKVKRAAQDINSLGCSHSTCSTTTCPTECLPAPDMPPLRRSRRPGPWRMLEIYTCTMLVGLAACGRGWEVGEPISAPGYDLYSSCDRAFAKSYVDSFDPDFVMVSWPSTLWMPVAKKGCEVESFENLGRERSKMRAVLAWIQEVVLRLRGRGIVVVAEHPVRSRAWNEPLLIDAFEGMPTGIAEMCAHGLRRPDGEWGGGPGRYLRRPTRVVGPRSVIEVVCRCCPGGHRHAPELGGVMVDGLWCPLGEFVGGYTKGFANKVMDGVERSLPRASRARTGEGFYVTPRVPEEGFMEEDADVIHSIYFDENDNGNPMELEAAPGGENQNHNNHDTDNHDEEDPSPWPEEIGPPDEFDDQAEQEELLRDLDRIPLEDQNHNNHGTDNHDEEEVPKTPVSVKDKALLERVHMLHRRLGHPSNEALVRLLQHGGAKDDVLRLAEGLVCPSCQLSKAPRRPFPSRPEVRAVVFNTAVHADLKYLRDFRGVVYVALSVIDEATNYHLAKLLRNREPAHVAAKFMSMWVGLFGPPQRIRLDQGGEWETDFIQLLEAHAIHSEFVGSHSPWSNGYAERHGALLGVAVQANVDEKQLTGRAQMKLGLSCACQAKNGIISRGGHSAHYLVFGRQAAYPELLDDEVWSRKSLGFALSIEGEVSRAAELRAAAKVALLRGDVLEKIRRALRRAPAGERRQYAPGELIYFWSPAKPKDRRYRRDLGSWRGPAVVLMPEGAERYFISWRGRCLLVSAPNIKGATVEECNRHDLRAEGLDLELAKGFIDCTDDAAPPDEPMAPFSVEGSGLTRRRNPPAGARKMTEARKMMSGLKAVRKTLKGPLENRRRRLLLPCRPRPPGPVEQEMAQAPEAQDQPIGPEGLQEAASLSEPTGEDSSLLPDVPQPWEDAPASVLPPEPAPYDYLDDVPFSIRKRLRDQAESGAPSTKRVRTTDFANYVLTALSSAELTGKEAKKNEWLPKGEVQRLAALLDLPLSSARLHRAPRKKLQHPGPRRKKPRVTVMFAEDPSQALVAEETAEQVEARPARKCPHLWRGVSLLLRGSGAAGARPKAREVRRMLLKRGTSFYEVTLDEETCQAAERDLEHHVFVTEALLLKAKANGKELDPRFFSEQEHKQFAESDVKEWKAWVDNKVVEELPPNRARLIPRSRIFAVPARVVRTNKKPPGESGLAAKSRIVLPGHLDPDIGSVRTDAPTTQMSAVRLAITLGLRMGWTFLLFDVSTAFLSGKAVDRDLYVRPPKDLRCVNASVLWKILKSAYGLSEAPRLWYIQAKDLLGRCGFHEVPWASATFVKRRHGHVIAILCLHVDDGFLAAKSGKETAEIKGDIDKLFSIKEWQTIDATPRSYLGMKIYVKEGVFYNDMTDYVLEIKPPCVPEGPEEAKLDAKGLREFRRIIAQIRWPVHLVMPEFLFSVSALAQRVSSATTADLGAAATTLSEVQQAARQGQALLRFSALRGKLTLVSFFDASLGKVAELAAQRGEVHFVAEEAVLSTRARANVLEFGSNKIARVVRSSLAAEGASMAACTDRLVYNLKLLDALLNGRLEVGPDWRDKLSMQGHLVTDARSLFDHVTGSSLLATERQVSLDILEVRQLVQGGTLKLHWVPTWRQFADGLTKAMKDELYFKLRRGGQINVVQTAEDEREEQYRAGLRKAQRERRKERLKACGRSQHSFFGM